MPYQHLVLATPALFLSTALVGLVGCEPTEANDEPAASGFYALVDGVEGVYFYPPLGPEPAAAGTFDGALLDGLSIAIEVQEADGSATTLGRFDQTTTPAVALLAERERYWLNIPAAQYLLDPSRTYQVRAFLDGAELGYSVLSSRIFDVMGYNPELPIGVHLRVEGQAVRTVRRQRLHGPAAHCSDHVRNKDETGVDCGGSCAPCQCNTTGGSTAGGAGCGWYYDPALKAACINATMASRSNMIYVGYQETPHPYPPTPSSPPFYGRPWLPYWVGYFCPSTMPRAVQQVSGSYVCYANCPAGTVQNSSGGCSCSF